MKRWISILISVGMLVVPFAAQAEGGERANRSQAEVEIAKLPVTYAWAATLYDIDLLMPVFSEDIVYDLSAYGFPPTVGKEAVKNLFLFGIFPFNQCLFITLSNIKIHVDGDTATGGDFFVARGYNPANQPPNTRSHTEGQHFFEFKKERGAWKISYMKGAPFFEKWEPLDPNGLYHCP